MTKWTKIQDDGNIRTTDTEKDGIFSLFVELFSMFCERKKKVKKSGKK